MSIVNISIRTFHNVNCHTAIDVGKVNNFEEKGEIIILRYLTFEIRLIQRNDNYQRIEIYFDKCNVKRLQFNYAIIYRIRSYS